MIRISKYLATLSLLCVLGWSACFPPQTPPPPKTIDLSVQDSVYQRISTLKDEGNVAALYPYFYHPNPVVRYQAALVFGSLTAPEAIDSLGRLLSDPVPLVRASAAFALGQQKEEAAVAWLLSGFDPTDTAMVFAPAQRAILEAVGKCGDESLLNQLAGVKTYESSDTLLVEGQILGIYQFGLRGIRSASATERAVELLDAGYPEKVRLYAANYLARSASGLATHGEDIRTAFERENVSNVRMALALALGKTATPAALTSLIGQYNRERDYRLKCNILRALSNFDYEKNRALVMEAIRDPNEHVARRAVQYLLENSPSEDAALWWRFAKDSLPAPVHIDLYQVANRHLPTYRTEYRDAINAELRQRYRAAASPYEQARILGALGEFAWNYRYLYREGQIATSPVVKTAAVQAMFDISEREDFDRFFGLSARRVTQDLAQYFVSAIQAGEPGPVAVAAQALRSESRDYSAYIDSVVVLERALATLDLPAEIESYNELAITIAQWKGEGEITPETVAFNHPINWKALAGLGDQVRMRLRTNEGDIVLELWPVVAPGTVANMLKLTRDGFFDGKAFHRVVPNFVVQGGSPSGDAYGSLDYTIRSEFSPINYDEDGLLGMASAGPNTEGTQFFITHSPTLHLDGRYTIFGQVVDGMDVVHSLQVGGLIEKAEVLK